LPESVKLQQPNKAVAAIRIDSGLNELMMMVLMELICINKNRKHCEKELRAFPHRGPAGHLDLWSLK
jgi:hypothetical protein